MQWKSLDSDENQQYLQPFFSNFSFQMINLTSENMEKLNEQFQR